MRSVEKKHRRFLAAMLTLCLLLGLCPLTPSAQAEETAEPATQSTVTNTTKETATEVNFEEEVKFTLSANMKAQWFKVTTTEPCQTIAIEGTGAAVNYDIYEPNGNSSLRTYSLGDNGSVAYARQQGTYYIRIYLSGLIDNGAVREGAFSIRQIGNDQYEPNDTMADAKELFEHEEKAIITIGWDEDWFKVTTTKPGQIIQLQCSAKNRVFAECYDASGKELSGSLVDGGCIATGEAGTYYLCFMDYVRSSPMSLTLYEDPVYVSVVLLDNDENEMNNTKAEAKPLVNGGETTVILASGDYDWFKITTDKPGQDIALTVSGYDYSNKDEKIRLVYEPGNDVTNRDICNGYAELSEDSTMYFHAAEKGDHYIALYLRSNYANDAVPACKRTLSVQVLDGDANEPNETKDTATPLPINTDKDFMVGGFGDEDWFSFEADPGESGKKLYTLNFAGLNTDYSDRFYYDIYAPNGTAVTTKTLVNIRHVNTFSCDQQGLYWVRVYTNAGLGTYNAKDYFANVWNGNSNVSMSYPRSTLRIWVSEGGDDPYESNDTWQTAASVPVGNIQHVLSSTTDADWFCFTVPENDMTLHLTSTKQTIAELYRADTLMKYGEDGGESEFGSRYNSSRTFTDMYFKLADAGTYYIKLTAGSSYVSTDIRTTGIELLPATDEENNDTWKKATPLYEGMLRSYTISAGNDADWFKIVVPKDDVQLRVEVRGSKFELYREQDFKNTGDNAAPIESWSNYSTGIVPHTLSLTSGIYYLKATAAGPMENCYIVYNILPTNTNSTLETAKTLKVGEWAEFYGYDMHYFSIGVRKAGEVVRISHDAVGGISANSDTTYRVKLLNASGEEVGSSYSYSANRTIEIPEDGSYYLSARAYWTLDDNGEPNASRLRYDIGSEDGKDPYVYSEEYIGMLEGETMFLDLYCRPENAKTNGGNSYYMTYDVAVPDCVSYDAATGYLSAKSAGTGVLKVSLKGEPDTAAMEIRITVLAKDSLKAQRVFVYAPDTMALGTSVDMEADYGLEDGAWLTDPQKAVTWTSSDPKVLYVAPGGKVTAVGSGSATVTATVGGTSDAVTITVTAAETPQETVSSIKLNKYSLTLYMNEEGEQLTATIQPASFAKSIVWNSSDTKVASVSDSGLVTAVGPGTCIISATAGDRHVSATVSVLAARVRVTGVSFGETKHEIPMGGTAKLTATIAPAGATVKTLVWTSDDPGIASVSRTGIVTAVSVGTTKIHATSVDGNHSAEVTVTVTAAPQLGDVNGDGYIDSADAMLCLRYSVGLAKELTEEQKRAADVNKDGFVDAGDAIKILRYDAKLIDSLN